MSTNPKGFPRPGAFTGHRRNAGLAASIAMLLLGRAAFAAAVLPGPSHSTNVALTYDNKRLVVANREADTVSVIAVRDTMNHDIRQKLAEIPVGIEPRCVANPGQPKGPLSLTPWTARSPLLAW
jgi:hypothetical protein